MHLLQSAKAIFDGIRVQSKQFLNRKLLQKPILWYCFDNFDYPKQNQSKSN